MGLKVAHLTIKILKCYSGKSNDGKCLGTKYLSAYDDDICNILYRWMRTWEMSYMTMLTLTSKTRNKTLRETWVKALRMGGLGGPKGTVSDRCGPLRYSEKHILEPCVTAKNKSVRPVGQSGQYLASRVGCYI